MSQQIGFIGLGAMGAAMARNLVRAGHAVRGYDVRAEALERLATDGGLPATSPAAAAAGAQLLIVIVFTAEQAEQVLFGDDGAAPALPPGAVVAMHTTMSPARAESMAARLEASGLAMLDAPVTGGVMGADAGTLTFIASGSERAMTAAAGAMQVMGAKVAHCGERVGAGSTVKMVNQLMCGVHVAVTAEALALAARAGADPAVAFDVIRSGAANSFVWENRVPSILARDYTPRGVVELFTKDLGIILDAGRDLSAYTPMAATAMQLFLAAEAAGHGRADDSAVIKVYEELMGVDVAGAAEGERGD